LDNIRPVELVSAAIGAVGWSYCEWLGEDGIPIGAVVQFLHFLEEQLSTATEAGGTVVLCVRQQFDPGPQPFRLIGEAANQCPLAQFYLW
jgi:hypothetical protein